MSKFQEYFVSTPQDVRMVIRNEEVMFSSSGAKRILKPALKVRFIRGKYFPKNEEEKKLLMDVTKKLKAIKFVSIEDQEKVEKIAKAREEAEARVRAEYGEKPAEKDNGFEKDPEKTHKRGARQG